MPNPLTAAELLDVARRNIDPAWLGILDGDNGPGDQILAAISSIWARVAIANSRNFRYQAMIQTSDGATPASMDINLVRDFGEHLALDDMGIELFVDGVPPPGTIQGGTMFVTDRLLVFRVSEDDGSGGVGVAAGQTAVALTALKSDRKSEQADAPDAFLHGADDRPIHAYEMVRILQQHSLANDPLPIDLSPGIVLPEDKIARTKLLLSVLRPIINERPVPLFDPLLSVTGVAIGTGGSEDMLDSVALERGVYRATGEVDDNLRKRALRIEDAVSPIAVFNAVNAVADMLGSTVDVLEPVDDLTVAGGARLTHIQSVKFAPSGTVPAPTTQTPLLATDLGELDALAYMLDDVLLFDGTPPMNPVAELAGTFYCDDPQSRVLSTREAFAYFLLVTDLLDDPDELRLFADDGYADDPIYGYPDILDHPVNLAMYLGVMHEAQRLKAGGVQFDLMLEYPPDFIRP